MDQIRTDAEQFDVVLAVVVDHPLQGGEVVRGHLRQPFRDRVALHEASDVRVGCADVEAGIADGHRGPPLDFLFAIFGFLKSALVSFTVILQ